MTYSEGFEYVRKIKYTIEPRTDTHYSMEIIKKGKKKIAVFAFRETITVRNWIDNFMFKKKPYKGMPFVWKAHRGFVRKWKSIEDEVLQFMKDNNPDEVIGLGYSQGAAINLFCAEDLWFHYPALRGSKMNFYSYATPRAFSWNAPMVRWNDVVRLSMRRDIVTKLPFGIMGYKHVGHEIVIDDTGLSDTDIVDELCESGDAGVGDDSKGASRGVSRGVGRGVSRGVGILHGYLKDFWGKLEKFIPTHKAHFPNVYSKYLAGL